MPSLKSVLFIGGLFLGGYGLGFDQIGIQFMSLFFMASITYLFFKSHEKHDEEFRRDEVVKRNIQYVNNKTFEKGLDIYTNEVDDSYKNNLSKKLMGSWKNDTWGIIFSDFRQCELCFPSKTHYKGNWNIEDKMIVRLVYFMYPELSTEYKFEIIEIIEGAEITVKDLTNDVGSIEVLYKENKVVY